MTTDSGDLRDYLAIQLRFAEEVARRSGKPLSEAVLFYTNIYRRLGLGIAGAAPPPDLWLNFVDGFENLTPDQRIARATEWLSARADGSAVLLPGRIGFGCFACEPPDAEGMVRIHFGNRENLPHAGPLHHTRIAARREELTAMFGFIAREHADARRVDGASWLYNIEAYRRLFPPAFAASRKASDKARTLHGLSHWGQFIDFRGRVRPEVRDAFLANLADLDVEKPWRAFPYQVLYTSAPFEAFRSEYGV